MFKVWCLFGLMALTMAQFPEPKIALKKTSLSCSDEPCPLGMTCSNWTCFEPEHDDKSGLPIPEPVAQEINPQDETPVNPGNQERAINEAKKDGETSKNAENAVENEPNPVDETKKDEAEKAEAKNEPEETKNLEVEQEKVAEEANKTEPKQEPKNEQETDKSEPKNEPKQEPKTEEHQPEPSQELEPPRQEEAKNETKSDESDTKNLPVGPCINQFCPTGHRCNNGQCYKIEAFKGKKGLSVGPCILGKCAPGYLCDITDNHCYSIQSKTEEKSYDYLKKKNNMLEKMVEKLSHDLKNVQKEWAKYFQFKNLQRRVPKPIRKPWGKRFNKKFLNQQNGVKQQPLPTIL